jgi:hypothetical protein
MKSRQAVIASGLVSACAPEYPSSRLSAEPSASKSSSWPSLQRRPPVGGHPVEHDADSIGHDP